MAKVTDVELQNISCAWVSNVHYTRDYRKEHLHALEVYWQLQHTFGPPIMARDKKILDIQQDQLKTNKCLAYL